MKVQNTIQAYKRSVSYLLQWTVSSLVLGPVCAAVVLLFQKVVIAAAGYAENSPFEFILPVVAGIFLGFMIYVVSPESSGEGVPMYIKSMTERNGYIDKVTTLMKFCAATLTLAFGGTGGLVGPMVMVNGGIGSFFGRRFIRKFLAVSRSLSFKQEDFRVVSLCGVAAALGALLRSPIGGGIFAVEVLYAASISYDLLFPAVLASASGYLFYSLMPWSVSPEPILMGTVSLEIIPGVLLSGVLAGLFGLLFVFIYNTVFNWFERLPIRRAWKPVIGGAICGLMGWVFYSLTDIRITGVGFGLYRDLHDCLFEAPVYHVPIILIVAVIIGRICMTSFTVGSGPSAGFTFPAFLIGSLIGHMVLHILPVDNPVAAHAFMAAGIAGSLAAILNIPLAACVVVMERFGLNFGLPAVLGGIIAYQIAKPTVIYTYVKEGPDA